MDKPALLTVHGPNNAVANNARIELIKSESTKKTETTA